MNGNKCTEPKPHATTTKQASLLIGTTHTAQRRHAFSAVKTCHVDPDAHFGILMKTMTDAEIRYLQSLRDVISYWQSQCKAVRLRPTPSDPGWRLQKIETMMSMIWHQLNSMTKGIQDER